MKTKLTSGFSKFGLLLLAVLSLTLTSQARSRRSDAPSSEGTAGSSFGSTVSGSQSSDPRQNPNAMDKTKITNKEYSNSGTEGMRDDTLTGSTQTTSKPAKPDSTTAGTGSASGTTDGTYGSEKENKSGTGQ